MQLLLSVFCWIGLLASGLAKQESSLEKLVRKLPDTIPDGFRENYIRLHRSREPLRASRKSKENLDLSAHLKTFVEVKKIDPMIHSIRALVSKAYRGLADTLNTLTQRHGLKLDEKTAERVLRDAVSVVGESRHVLGNATADFGRRIVTAMTDLNVSLTSKQATALSAAFSAWLNKRHFRLQRVLGRCLARHGAPVTRGEAESAATEVLAISRLPTSLSRVKSGLDQNLKIALVHRLHEFMAQTRLDVSQLIKERGLNLDSSNLNILVTRIDSNVSWVMSDALNHLQHMARRLLTGLPLPKDRVEPERLLRDLTAGADITVQRLARRDLPLIFFQHNVTADANALLQLARRALKERAKLQEGPRELRMKIRIPLAYPQAVARAAVVHSELRREVGRVAQVLPDEVEILSMDSRAAVGFRIVARGFDPLWAEQRLRNAITGRHFVIRVDGRNMFALPPPPTKAPRHMEPSPVFYGVLTASIIIILVLLVSSALTIQRKRKSEESEKENSGTKIPYAKVCEPEMACA